MSSKLFVGNLNYDATESDLENHFSPSGVVVEVTLVKDRESGRSRGFAFVLMGSDEDAQTAIDNTDQQDFMGRRIVVSVAKPKEDRPPRSGGGDRGGSRGPRPERGGERPERGGDRFERGGGGSRNDRGGRGGERRGGGGGGGRDRQDYDSY